MVPQGAQRATRYAWFLTVTSFYFSVTVELVGSNPAVHANYLTTYMGMTFALLAVSCRKALEPGLLLLSFVLALVTSEPKPPTGNLAWSYCAVA